MTPAAARRARRLKRKRSAQRRYHAPRAPIVYRDAKPLDPGYRAPGSPYLMPTAPPSSLATLSAIARLAGVVPPGVVFMPPRRPSYECVDLDDDRAVIIVDDARPRATVVRSLEPGDETKDGGSEK
jgi:hypothetical protein